MMNLSGVMGKNFGEDDEGSDAWSIGPFYSIVGICETEIPWYLRGNLILQISYNSKK